MTVLSEARSLLALCGHAMDAWRGPVPAPLLAYWAACETGGDRLAVSRDPVLIECGLSQAPLARCLALDVDPFDDDAGVWLLCYEAAQDYDYWSRYLARRIDTLYWMLLDYSLGRRAARQVLALCESRTTACGPGRQEQAIWLASNVDLDAIGGWGSVSGAKVAKRLREQARRLCAAAELGPLDGPPGGSPTPRPDGLQRLPRAIRSPALVCASNVAPPDVRARALQEVRDYVRQRRRREFRPTATLAWRGRRLLDRLRGVA